MNFVYFVVPASANGAIDGWPGTGMPSMYTLVPEKVNNDARKFKQLGLSARKSV